MKILLVTWYFPPANTIASLRMSKLAAHLKSAGHDVHVLTVRDRKTPMELAGDLEEARVTATRWIDLKDRSRRAMTVVKRRRPTRSPPASGVSADATPDAATIQNPRKTRSFRRVLRELLFFPDRAAGWIPYALGAGNRLLREWRPDLVYASGPPFSALIAGWRLARRQKLPLITEFRDRWSDDPYFDNSPPRQRLEHWVESRIVRDAHGLVTVSEPWAEIYRERFGKPVHVLYNGFDPERVDPTLVEHNQGGPLRIVYTGQIYPGFRDPSMLFAAIARLGAQPGDVVVDFYGTSPEHVWPLAVVRFADGVAFKKIRDTGHDPHRGLTVPKRYGLPSARPVRADLTSGRGDFRWWDETIRSELDCHGALCIGTYGQARNAQIARLLLDAARIREHGGRTRNQIQERDIAQRLDEVHRPVPAKALEQVGGVETRRRARMQRQHHRIVPGNEAKLRDDGL